MFHSRSEHGQVLVLILIALAGLMGFAALVVDGGHLYSERRRAQSAADAAALAAASAGSKGQSEADIAAVVSSQANENGFFNGTSNTVVTYNHPPVSGPYAGNSEYYQVFIKQDIPPIFSQFVFQGTQQVTVEAIARARGYTPLTGDNALMAIASCACGPAIVLDGNVEMLIRGGKVFSNDRGEKTGKAGDIWIYASPDPKDSTMGEVVTYGSWDEAKRAQMHANFITVSKPVALDEVPQPYCPASNTTIDGVNYYVWDGDTMAGEVATKYGGILPPGIHCVDGTIDLTGKYKDLSGSDVLLVLKDGGFKSKGNSHVNLTRADSLIDMNGNQWGGMVIYSPKENKSKWDFGGNAGDTNKDPKSVTTFNGTLYAPGATCDLGGTPENQNIHAAFVCWDFKIHGNPRITITYIPEENWQLPPSLSLMQ